MARKEGEKRMVERKAVDGERKIERKERRKKEW